jgi:HlyD family secretion protein
MNRKALLVLGAVVLATAATVAYCVRPQAIAVTTVKVDRGTVRRSVANTRAGTINACRRAKLAPATGGQIARLNVRKGDRVKAEQLLIELWNDDGRAQLALAERDAVAARARAEEACTSATVARSEARRWQQLREQKVVSEDAAERATGEADSREAACRATRAGIGVADARVAAARATLERTRVRAPFDGVVAEINGELGEFVTPSPIGIATPPSVDLIDTSCLYITAPIDEVDAPSVRNGMPARITLDAFPGRQYEGHVRRVAPYVLDVEKQSRTVEVEVEIDSREGRENLLPGYSADVEVVLAVEENALRVPTQSLIKGRDVLVVDPATHRVRRQELVTGVGNWEFTQVRKGLDAGAEVITSLDRAGVVEGALVKVEGR